MKFNKTTRSRVRLSKPLTTTHEDGLAYDLSEFSNKDVKRLNLYLNTASNMLADDTFYTFVSDEMENLLSNVQDIVDLDMKHGDKFVLQLAAYLRQKKLLRRVPHFVLVSAFLSGNYPAEVLSEYVEKTVGRPDDLAEMVSIFNFFNENVGEDLNMSPAVRSGMAEALVKFNEYQLMKYELSGRQVRLIDVMRLCKNQLLGKNDTVDAVFGYFDGKRSRRHSYLSKLPLTKARKELFSKDGYDTEVSDLIKTANVTWEQVISHFGNKKEIWIDLLDAKILPGLAFVRNIRNMLLSGVSCERLVEYAGKANVSRVYPHHITGAYSVIADDYAVGYMGFYNCRRGSNDEQKKVNGEEAAKILDVLFERVIQEVDIDGVSVVLPDLSGSMFSPVAGKESKLTRAMAASTLGLACAYKSRVVVPWASTAKFIRVSKKDYMCQFEKIMNCSRDVGAATNIHLALQYLVDREVYADRIIILSDMQVWDPGRTVYWASDYMSTAENWLNKYKAKINKDVWLHSVDLASYGRGQQGDPEKNNVNLMAGFTADILQTMKRVEDGVVAKKKPYEVILEEIRAM